MSDTRTIVFSIIGTGIATITILVSFVAIIAGGINNRIDDVNTNVNSRIDDVNGRIDDLQNDIRELRSLVIDAIKGDELPDD